MNLWQRVLARITTKPAAERIYVPQMQAGVRVSEDTALTFSAVWACVRVIAETIASLPWHVYEKTAEGREQLDNWQGWMLNAQSNPEMTASAFRETLVGHALTWGNGYAEIVRDMANRAVEMWPLLPDRMTPTRDDSGALVYEYRQDDGSKRVLQPANVFHLHGLSYDGVCGYSPVRMAARSIGAGIAQDTFASSFYANGTIFGGMVEVPRTMSRDQIEEQEKYLNDKHGGPAKAFKIRIVGEGMKYVNQSMPMTDAQFLETRKFSVNEVARWFRVPPHKIADLDRSTNNNIEHQGIEFLTDTLLPWLTRLEQEANVKIVGPRSQGRIYTRMQVAGLLRADATARVNFYAGMTRMGAMSINEVRQLEELNKIEGGDEHLVQLNQTTLERLTAEPVEPPVQQGPVQPQEDTTDESDPEETANAQPRAIAAVR